MQYRGRLVRAELLTAVQLGNHDFAFAPVFAAGRGACGTALLPASLTRLRGLRNMRQNPGRKALPIRADVDTDKEVWKTLSTP